MATAFRIHEDIENVIDTKKDKKNHGIGKNIAKDKRPTFAILNNVTLDNRNIVAHAQKTVSFFHCCSM